MSNELFTIAEVAQQMKTTPRNIWAMIADGRFGPSIHKLGRRSVRVNASEFSAWVNAGLPSKAEWSRNKKGGAR